MEDIKYFAVLNNNNEVINTTTFPKNPDPVPEQIWKDFYIWIYDGSFWNHLNEIESLNIEDYQGETYYVDSIVGDTQNYLNGQFPNAQENTIVINKENFPDIISVIPTPEIMLKSYPEFYKLKEYSLDQSITNNPARIPSTYDEDLNAFIVSGEDDTYNLNFETFEWEPDLNVDYDLHGDGIMYRWDGDGWIFSPNILS